MSRPTLLPALPLFLAGRMQPLALLAAPACTTPPTEGRWPAMTAPLKPSLPAEIASVPVDAGAAERWAHFLPGLVEGGSPDARQRELAFRQGLAVPEVDVEAEAAAILADCPARARIHKKPGIRATLLLADLARHATFGVREGRLTADKAPAPLPPSVVQALAAALGLVRLHTDKRTAGIDWADDETPLKVLGYLAAGGDEHAAAIALYDSVLWLDQQGRVTTGRLLNGLAALFGFVDPATGAVNFEALANAAHVSRLDHRHAVADYVDGFEQKVDRDHRRALARLAEEFGHPASLRNTEEAKIADAQAVEEAVKAGLPIRRPRLDELVDNLDTARVLDAATPDEEVEIEVRVAFTEAVKHAEPKRQRPGLDKIVAKTGVKRSTAHRLVKDGDADHVVEKRRQQRVLSRVVGEQLKGMRSDAFATLDADPAVRAAARQRLRNVSGTAVEELESQRPLTSGERRFRDKLTQPEERDAAAELLAEMGPVAEQKSSGRATSRRRRP